MTWNACSTSTTPSTGRRLSTPCASRWQCLSVRAAILCLNFSPRLISSTAPEHPPVQVGGNARVFPSYQQHSASLGLPSNVWACCGPSFQCVGLMNTLCNWVGLSEAATPRRENGMCVGR